MASNHECAVFFEHHVSKFKLLQSHLRVLEVESPLVVCVVADGQKLSQVL